MFGVFWLCLHYRQSHSLVKTSLLQHTRAPAYRQAGFIGRNLAEQGADGVFADFAGGGAKQALVICYTNHVAGKQKQKLYCYVDETGQDSRSKVFVVVAVVTEKEQQKLRQQIVSAEQEAGLGLSKWNNASHRRRIKFLSIMLERSIGKGDVFYGSYQKPIPYFFPMLDLIAKAIKAKVKREYQTRIYVDGVDSKKARELTNALRIEGISLEMVKSRRDESEPLIRLADRWAGCVRAHLEGKKEAKSLVIKAKQTGYLREIEH